MKLVLTLVCIFVMAFFGMSTKHGSENVDVYEICSSSGISGKENKALQIGECVISHDKNLFVYRYWIPGLESERMLYAVAGYDGKEYWLAYYGDLPELDSRPSTVTPRKFAKFAIKYESFDALNCSSNNGLLFSQKLCPDTSKSKFVSSNHFPRGHHWFYFALPHWMAKCHSVRFSESPFNEIPKSRNVEWLGKKYFFSDLCPCYPKIGISVFGEFDVDDALSITFTQQLTLAQRGTGPLPQAIEFNRSRPRIAESREFRLSYYCDEATQQVTKGYEKGTHLIDGYAPH